MDNTSAQDAPLRKFFALLGIGVAILWRLTVYGVLAFIFVWVTEAFVSLKDPEDAIDVVFEPSFTLVDSEIWAGKMFVAEVEQCVRPVVVSAKHLFGPSGGYARELSSTEWVSTP